VLGVFHLDFNTRPRGRSKIYDSCKFLDVDRAQRHVPSATSASLYASHNFVYSCVKFLCFQTHINADTGTTRMDTFTTIEQPILQYLYRLCERLFSAAVFGRAFRRALALSSLLARCFSRVIMHCFVFL